MIDKITREMAIKFGMCPEEVMGFCFRHKIDGDEISISDLENLVYSERFESGRLRLLIALVKSNGGPPDLSGTDLSGASLSGMNFSEANLVGVNFTKADLTGANFTGANLTGANFTEAFLTAAKLIKANLSYANFTEANLTGANFIGANLTGSIPFGLFGEVQENILNEDPTLREFFESFID